MGYRPGLDGIRALAVIGVLLYHGGVWWMPGGFLGVDLFFALSGYLITALLLTEFRRSQTIDLRDFYIRRARRLLPALFLVLGFVAVYAARFSSPDQLNDIRWDGFATLGYVANWRFVFNEASYFDQFQDPSPLRHMWSLGIEEQWYLLSPALLAFGLRRWGPSSWVWPAGVVALAVASATLMAVLFDPVGDPSRVYYGTDTRLQTLLIGALLAFMMTRWTLGSDAKRVVGGAGAVGLLLVLLGFRLITDTSPAMYRGGFALFAVAAVALVAAAATPGTLVARALAVRPLVGIGKISYGLYLWHWPIFVYLSPERTGIDGDALLALRLAVTAAVSVASYHLVEMPIRTGALQRSIRPISVAVLMAIVLTSVLIVGPAGRPNDAVASGAEEVDGVVRAGDGRVLVVGDSVALSLAAGHDRSATNNSIGVRSAAILGCGVGLGAVQPQGRPVLGRDCSHWPDRWQDGVSDFDPDVSVVLVGAWEVFDRVLDGQLLEVGTAAYAEHLTEQLARGTDVLTSRGGRVVLLTVPCMDPQDRVGGGILVERASQPRAEWLSEVIRRFAEIRPDVVLADIREFQCPGGDYRAEIDGVTLHGDGVHYTPEGASVAWRYLAPIILDEAANRTRSG